MPSDGARVEAGEELDGLADLDLFLQIGGLQAHADAVFELARLHFGIVAEHGNASAAARAQAFEDLDGAGFAGAVGAEQAEDFARAHFEIDALHGGERAVGFFEPLNLNGIIHGREQCLTGIRAGERNGSRKLASHLHREQVTAHGK